ncbi:hypothetical protein OAU75_01850 [Flavobacteriaceae bacterium]|nr:hypothetical protein [Flavobacteriaceae bacterium]
MRLILKLSIIALFFSCTNPEKKATDLLSCVPQNTLAILRLNDQNMITNAFSNSLFIEKILALNSVLYSETISLLPDELPNEALLCYTPEGKSGMGVTFLCSAKPQDNIHLPKGKSFEYDNVKVVATQLNKKKLYHTLIKDIFISSSSKLILENIIRNIKNNRLGIQEGILNNLAKISDENAAFNLFIRKEFNTTFDGIFHKTPLFPFLGSSWYSFDFNTKKEPFTLDGVSFINDSIQDKISLLKGQDSQQLITPQVVPQNFDSYFGLSIADYKALENQFKKYIRHLNIPLNKISFDILSSVDEISWVQLQENQTVIFHINNTEIINSQLFSISNYQGNFRGINLYAQEFNKDLNILLNTLGSFSGAKWSTQLDDFLVYSNSESDLKQIIGNYLDKKTLFNDLDFKILREDLADKSSFLWLGKTPNLKNKWKSASKERKATWEKINIDDYPLIVLQGVSDNNFIQTRLTAQKKNLSPQKNSVISKYNFSLDAPASRTPQWLKNHRNKTMDIVVQDEKNILYLFSNTGKLYWKKELDGQIIGKIKQVDLYRNKRLQMAFRTPNRFQILDRNGKIVPPFDIKLSGQTPSHISVFDYDLTRNYRFLITDRKKVRMIDNRGKTVNGFQLKSLKNGLANPPKHIRFGTKDYIVIQSSDGTVRILNRQGRDRIKLKEPLITSDNPIFGYRDTFAGTSKSGEMFQVDSKGNILLSKLELAEDHQIDMTTKSLVTLDGNSLKIKGIPLNLPFGKYTSPKIHYINNTIYVLLTELETKKVYAYLSNGSMVGGFPIYGTATPDLSNADGDSALEMVVQSESDGFIIYELN